MYYYNMEWKSYCASIIIYDICIQFILCFVSGPYFYFVYSCIDCKGRALHWVWVWVYFELSFLIPLKAGRSVPTIVSCQVWKYYADFALTAPACKSEHGGSSVLQKTFPKLEILNFPIQFREVARYCPWLKDQGMCYTNVFNIITDSIWF